MQEGRMKQAIDFYVSVFKNSKRIGTYRYGEMGEVSGNTTEDDIAYADFEIEGQKFAAMDSRENHEFIFNEAVSLLIECNDQEEIDYYWEMLSAVPEAEQCGWLKDQFGVSWQVAPKGMDEILNSADREKANHAMEAFLKMKKVDIATLEEAIRG
jgi:predicted 3-demethylubiquinone-9 3-methyltransferase (glyoxalase superfamily)